LCGDSGKEDKGDPVENFGRAILDYFHVQDQEVFRPVVLG